MVNVQAFFKDIKWDRQAVNLKCIPWQCSVSVTLLLVLTKGFVLLTPLPLPVRTVIAFSKSCIARAACGWVCVLVTPKPHGNVSCSPAGVRSGISFLSGWQLWNTSLCLSHLVSNLPSNVSISCSYAAPQTFRWWLRSDSLYRKP